MTRRSRVLTAEERRLWAEVARLVRPLSGAPVEAPEEVGPESAPPAPKPRSPKARPTSGPRTAVAKPAPLVPLERRAARALSRGRSAPDATLDLHGLTQAEAHARLLAFLRGASRAGHGLVLVVTGRGGEGERGVLRRSVPHWLQVPELRPIVLGFQEAGARQGGAGALYVRLRRQRAEGRPP